MSGIVGIIYRNGCPVNLALLTRMTDVIAHRGPNGVNHWVDGSVGLGHRMLHSTPESLYEYQPLMDESGALCLVLDGRIDNRDELVVALKTKGVILRTDTDAEIVLKAYGAWGEDCPKRIIGDFAFAIWDGWKQELFCARDSLGLKPFYYYVDGNKFVFASEMQPLFAAAAIEQQPNLSVLGQYLLGHYNEQEQTLYSGVFALPAATSLRLTATSIYKTQYWDIDPAYQIRYNDDKEYAEHFLSLFQEAVRCRLRRHGLAGAMLSGGLDSSSVVCTAYKLEDSLISCDKRLKTFSIVFDELPCDERNFINPVIDRWHVDAAFFPHEQESIHLALESLTKYPDVLYAPTLLMYLPALRAIQSQGVSFVLDGAGGDELLAPGFEHLTDLFYKGKYYQLLSQLNNDALTYSLSPFYLFEHYCLRPAIPASLKKTFRPFIRILQKKDKASWLNHNLVATLNNAPPKAGDKQSPKFESEIQKVIYRQLFCGWNSTIAYPMIERLYARFSVERRSPFLDQRLVQFLLAIPSQQRWQGNQPKMILRNAMKGILPETVRLRQAKMEFSAVVDRELKYHQDHKVRKLFQDSLLYELGLIDINVFRKLLNAYQDGTSQYLTGTIELVVGLELFCRSITAETKFGL